MRITTSERGFRFLKAPIYLDKNKEARVVSESSAMGNYEDSDMIPGSSFLWLGEHHHLNREEVRQLIGALQYWLDHKQLPEAI